MKRMKTIFIILLIAALTLQACNLPAVGVVPQGGEDTELLQTITAQALILEQAGQTATPITAQNQAVVYITATADGAASATPEAVIPAAVLPPATGPVTVTVSVATNCRKGPGAAFASVYGMPVGQVAKVVAKNESSGYWIIEIPGQNGQTCWLWGRYATVTGDTASLKVAITPTSAATQTATATKVGAATATASATPTATKTSGSGAVAGCMDPTASNYDPKATTANGTCTYTKPNAPVFGVSFVNCTPAANGQMNYAVTLAWTDNSNNESGFNLYTNTALFPISENNTSYTFPETYPAGTTLNVSLTAGNNAGQSSPATTQFTCVAPVTKPNAPTISSATCGISDSDGNNSFTYFYSVSWTDNSSNETGFSVSGPDGNTNYPANATTHNGTYVSAPPPFSINLVVSAFNTAGSSSSSGIYSFLCK